MKIYPKVGLMSTLLAFGLTANAEDVKVHINSGNPAYPFPQFAEYVCGGNLGTQLSEGLSHAEIEQQIRQAYQQFAYSFKYTGDEFAGIRYIKGNDGCPYDCTEGDGYALLAAAYMADKVTFDGLWMRTHDLRRVKSKTYMECEDINPDCKYGDNILNEDPDYEYSVTDGSEDVALALYIAYKQWGEFMLDENGEKVVDACGNPISYKQELVDVVNGLVEFTSHIDKNENPLRVLSGIIGLDGYVKGGNKWSELTDWASQEENYLESNDGKKIIPEYAGGYTTSYIDFLAPAYYREFHDLLKSLDNDSDSQKTWEREQFRRAETSSDWLMGQFLLKSDKAVPVVGQYTVNADGTKTTFESTYASEDFRTVWRTVSHYVWHGNPEYSWNPVTHKVVDGANKYEYDVATRMSEFLNDPAHWNEETENQCLGFYDLRGVEISSPWSVGLEFDPMTGANKSEIFNNWLSGTSSFSAIATQDYELMRKLYSICRLRWDSFEETEEGNLVPRYFDGWFRQLGMMALTGNYVAPSEMNAKPNMKIYRVAKDSVSSCRVGDTITYKLSYRNFGSKDAENVVVVENVPVDFSVTSIDNGGSYDASSHTITWKIGKVSGFKSDDVVGPDLDLSSPNLAKTMGEVSYSCVAKSDASGKYAPVATIQAKDCKIQETDKYSNDITATLVRNTIDIIPSSLNIEKRIDRDSASKGDSVNISVAFVNSDSMPVLTGGHSKVNFSIAQDESDGLQKLKIRAFNNTDEPINLGNYRISYFIKYFDKITELFYDIEQGAQVIERKEPITFNFMLDYAEGAKKEDVMVESILQKDSSQVVQINFADNLMMDNVNGLLDNQAVKHNVGIEIPLNLGFILYPMNYGDIVNDGGWSKLLTAKDRGLYYPISPSYATDNVVKDVNRLIDGSCDVIDDVVETVMVEEFDGHTWRKVLGESPNNGVIVKNVIVTDSIPAGLEFIGFSENDSDAVFTPLAAETGFSGVVSYKLDSMKVGERRSFNYKCRVVGNSDLISLDGARITANPDKNHVDKASSNAISLTIKEPTDVKNNAVVEVSSNVDVYNVQGQKLKSNVNEREATNGLSNGVYLVGDKKVVVNK